MAHMSGLDTSTYVNGDEAFIFTLQPENQWSVNVLCHEMFHSMGAPDLYHYDFDGMSPAVS